MFQIVNFLLFISLFYIVFNQFAGEEVKDAVYISYEQCDTSFKKLPGGGEIYSSRNSVNEQECIDKLNSARYITIGIPVVASFLIAFLSFTFLRLIFLYIVFGSIRPPKK